MSGEKQKPSNSKRTFRELLRNEKIMRVGYLAGAGQLCGTNRVYYCSVEEIE